MLVLNITAPRLFRQEFIRIVASLLIQKTFLPSGS